MIKKNFVNACGFLIAASISQFAFSKPTPIICVDDRIYDVVKLVISEDGKCVNGGGDLSVHGYQKFKDPFILNCNNSFASILHCEGAVLTHKEGEIIYSLNGELFTTHNGEIELKFKNVVTYRGYTVDLTWISYFLSFFDPVRVEEMNTMTCTIIH